MRFVAVSGVDLEGVVHRPGESVHDLGDWLGPEATDVAVQAHRRALSGEPATYFDIEVGGKTLHAHVEPIRDRQGAVVGVIGVKRDLTARRMGESALAEIEGRLEALYQGIPIPTYSWRRDGDDFVLVDANEAGKRAAAGRWPQYEGGRASEIYADEPEILADIRRAVAERTVVERELPYTVPGTDQPLYLRATYAFVPPDQVVVHLENLSERKRAEDEVRDQEGRLAVILEHSSDPIFIIDPANDEILQANGRAALMLAYTPEELLGVRPSDVHSEEMPGFTDLMEKVMREGSAWSDEFSCIAKDGRWIPVEMEAARTRYRGRQAVINMVRPLTHLREIDHSLRYRLEAGRRPASGE
jgi:PAS domain S-box-containing protein